jgi:hypothetical protein
MVLKDFLRETICLIETSLDSKCILNKKSGKLLAFEFDINLMEFLLGTRDFDET